MRSDIEIQSRSIGLSELCYQVDRAASEVLAKLSTLKRTSFKQVSKFNVSSPESADFDLCFFRMKKTSTHDIARKIRR